MLPLLYLLVSFCAVASSVFQEVIYISPQNTSDSSCSVDGTVWGPCYSFYELIRDGVLSSLNSMSVSLLLLPGTHTISEGQDLEISGFDEVLLHSQNNTQKVFIECSTPGYHIHLDNNSVVSVSSLHFNSCLMTCGNDKNEVNIAGCTFENGRDASTILISNLNNPEVVNVKISNCKFLSNSEALHIKDIRQTAYITARVVITDTLFQDNGRQFPATHVLLIDRTDLKVKKCQFIGNNASLGAIYGLTSFLDIADTVFYKNHAVQHGGAIRLQRSTLNLDRCNFTNSYPGAIHILGQLNQHSNIKNSTFQSNTAEKKGGALYVKNAEIIELTDCHFQNNSADQGGAIYTEDIISNFSVTGSSFLFNEARSEGGAIYCKDQRFNIKGQHSVSNSARVSGGFAYLTSCTFEVTNYHFRKNTASNGGAFYADSGSHITVTNTTMAGNEAGKKGGGMYLANSVQVALLGATFDGNVAASEGGAIYHSDEHCEIISQNSDCFINERVNGEAVFTNNTASQGQVLYGGLLDRCCANSPASCPVLGIDYFKNISQYDTAASSAVTSDPVKVCLCTEESEIECSNRSLTLHKMKGQTVELSGVIVDQDGKPKTSFVRASYSDYVASFGEGEDQTEVSENCTSLTYHVYTRNDSVKLLLQPEGVCEHSEISTVTVLIHIENCLGGFQEDNTGKKCVCDQRLVDKLGDSIVCDVDDQSIQVQDSMVWIRYDADTLELNIDCPPDYCNSIRISLEFPDEQCVNSRSGLLCGQCGENHSMVLGNSRCQNCTSRVDFVWLVPLFALAGVGFVALLLVFNLNISHGTLNGLIFYANVVSVSGLTQFNCFNPILSIFIAWVNLDLGVETCFYPGMDTYQKTWLQFVFPLYIWFLVGAVILVSHYSTRAMKILGRNNIALLATLFLLSYAKILNTIITVFNSTDVFSGSANSTSDPLVPYKVWKRDGSIEYLSAKHVPLFAVALLFLIFLFLPYTLLLTFGQCIRSLQTRRRFILRCINSTAFVSIMDAYHAPYTNKHRYWTGLMLLVRCVLFFSFAFGYSKNNLFSNMYITTIVLTAVFCLRICISKVYKNFGINLLELSFLLNLAILSSTLYYLQGNGNSDFLCICTSVSISISLISFTGILLYHAYLQVKKTKCFKSNNDWPLASPIRGDYQEIINEDENSAQNDATIKLPTTTTVELYQ